MSDYDDDDDYYYTQSDYEQDYYDDDDTYDDGQNVNSYGQACGDGPSGVYDNNQENVEPVGYAGEVYDNGGQIASYCVNEDNGQGYDHDCPSEDEENGSRGSYYESEEYDPSGSSYEDEENGEEEEEDEDEEYGEEEDEDEEYGEEEEDEDEEYGEKEDEDEENGEEEEYDEDEGDISASVGIYGQDDGDGPSESYYDDEEPVEQAVGYYGEDYDSDGQNASYYGGEEDNSATVFGQGYYEEEDNGPSMRSSADLCYDGSSNTYNAQSVEQKFGALTLNEPVSNKNRRSAIHSKGYKSNNQIVNMPSGIKATISRPVHSPCKCSRNCVGQSMTLTTLSVQLGGDYATIHAEMHKTLGAHNFSRYNIMSIQKVGNCCLWKKFRVREKIIAKEFGRVNERMLFHGSSAAEAIAKTGFDISRANPAGMFGPGAYFAEHSSKSNGYAAGYLGHRKMLICRVALGNMFDRTQADKMKRPPRGYHSVRGVPTPGGLLYPEYVVYHNDQAYPEYLVSYNIE